MAEQRRALSQIAEEIQEVWPKPYFGAVPYIEALSQLTLVTDKFYEDPARDIIVYFLSNASYWRGPDAKRIKAELKEIIAR